jgi:hypothetical protein
MSNPESAKNSKFVISAIFCTIVGDSGNTRVLRGYESLGTLVFIGFWG